MSYRLQARMTALLYHYVLDAVLHEEGMETAKPIVHAAMKKWGEWRGLEMRTEHERRGWPLSEGKCGGILAFEGFESLGSDLRFLDLFYKLGLCVASLTHSRRNFFADGTQQDVQSGGLTTLGKQAVKRMNEQGIVIDLGHLNQVGFWEVLELS
jgi:microsomal dipeptidase-like Zn-dependent dipeptidase